VSPSEGDLLEVLLESRALGYLGPGPVEPQLEHAAGFADVAEAELGGAPAAFVDLGTGGGIPGLVLAVRWPGCQAHFLEASARRAASLRSWGHGLGLGHQITVLEGRGEEFAHVPGLREQFPLVTARSFAGPAATAEIGTGFLEVGGLLVVSEPPEPDEGRWPASGLAEMGFGPKAEVSAQGRRFVRFRKVEPAREGLPRAVGRPGKRPRW
jgi:16S rRNA (guanine527-N7)-methyltransferase